NDRLKKISLCLKIPTMVGSSLKGIIRNECHLFRPVLFNQFKKGFARKTFNVKFGLRKFFINKRANIAKIGKTNMTLVRPGMNSKSGCTGSKGNAPKPGNTGPRKIPTVAQHSNSIQVHGQFRRHKASLPNHLHNFIAPDY